MRFLLRRLSVFKVMLCWGLIVYTPTAYYTTASLDSLDAKLIQLRGTTLEYAPSQSDITAIGRFLREHQLPWTEPVADNESGSLQFTLDSKAAHIYMMLLVMSLSVSLWSFVTLSVHNSYRRLINALEEFADNQTLPNESYFGPWDHHQVSRSLEKLQSRLRNEEEERALYLRNISHEIKTPLTSIKEGSSLLSEISAHGPSDEVREVSGIIERSGEKLHKAINELLEYNTRLSHTSVKLREHVDISSLARTALDNHYISIRNKELSIVEKFEVCRCFVDSDQIAVVIDNLLSNAIKHSPKGGVITITIHKRSPRGARMVILDEGPGVSADQTLAIFDPYYIGHDRSDSSVQDTGLGLAIAKQFIDAHNGSLRLLESSSGAKFEVLLK